MRKKVFNIIEPSRNSTDNIKWSAVYDCFMIVVIIISLIPLLIKETYQSIYVTELITTCIFIIDYILRWITADFKLQKGKKSFFLYPISFMAIIDLLSILPSIIMLNGAFRLLKIIRLLRALKVFRIFKISRYSKSLEMIKNVCIRQKHNLLVLCWIAIAYIIITALLIFNVEPDTFDNFFEALYWAVVSLTTIGYGDIYTLSTLGRIITMISAFVGIAIVALPAGMMTAGFMDELSRKREEEKAQEKETESDINQ